MIYYQLRKDCVQLLGPKMSGWHCISAAIGMSDLIMSIFLFDFDSVFIL